MPYTRSGSLPVVFNSRDEDLHKQLKTPIASLFSVSNISAYEPLVDTVLDVACKSLDERFAKTGKVFDLTDWLQYFAFDVMGSMTFSKRYGFLEEGRDVDGILQTIWTFMQTIAPVSEHVICPAVIIPDENNRCHCDDCGHAKSERRSHKSRGLTAGGTKIHSSRAFEHPSAVVS